MKLKTIGMRLFFAAGALALSFSLVSCKDSKKHKKGKSTACDAECEARKERERLANQQNAQGDTPTNQLGVVLTIDGQPAGSSVPMGTNDTAALQFSGNFNAQAMMVGLKTTPQNGIALLGTTLQTSGVPAGSYPITILVRDRAKCQSAGGSDCTVALNNRGVYNSPPVINPAYDAEFNFTIIADNAAGNGGGNSGGNQQQGNGTWNPPGFSNPNQGFFSQMGENLTYGVNWVWTWLKGLGQR